MFKQVIASSEFGSLEVVAESGTVKLTGHAKAELGGGAAKGVVSFESANSIVVQDVQLVQLSLDYLKSKLPEAMHGAIDALEGIALPYLKSL